MTGKPYDFRGEWEKTKKQLNHLRAEAAEFAKKGEKELMSFSQKSKLQIDSTSLSLKKERLLYLVGKEYVQLKNKSKASKQLEQYLDEIKEINRELGMLKRKLSVGKKKKTVKKTS